MPRKNLTARFVETVKVETRTDYQDEMVRGLWLRVSPSGARTWQAVYTRASDGTKQRVKLGRYPGMTLEKARTAALKMMTAVADGDDPADEKRASRAAMTVADLGALYIKKHAKPNKRTWAEDQRILDRDVYPFVGRMKAHAVKRRDILDVIDAKVEAGKVVQSRRVLAVVRKMFGWAVDQDYLQSSPVAGIKPRGKATQRDRVLSDDEIEAIWNALPDASLFDATKDVLRLLFLTGQRSGEVAGITADEIDMDRATWTIPASRTKNGRTHVVPLSPAALAIVEPWLDRVSREPNAPLFARVEQAIESNAIAAATRKHLQLFDERWTPHDIRRTVATGAAGIGIQPHIIEATLNHVSGFKAGVAGIYNRAAYEPEKRRALDMWAEHLDAIVTGRTAKVVPLKAGA